MQSKADLFPDLLGGIAEGAKALAHPARLAILRELAEADACVCGALVEALPLAQSTVSQHLKVLKQAGLVVSHTDGQRTCYCLDRQQLLRLREGLDSILGQVLDRGEKARCMPEVALASLHDQQ